MLSCMGMEGGISHETVLKAVDVGVMACRADGRLRFANEATLRLLGVRLDELMDKTSEEFGWDVIDPEGDPIPFEEMPSNRALRDREAQKDCLLGVLRPGTQERLWLLVSSHPQFDSEGELVGTVTSLSDVSARRAKEDVLRRSNKRLDERVNERTAALEETVSVLRDEVQWRMEAQAELTRREARYASMLRSMAEGVIVHDAHGAIVDVNPAAVEILGVTRESILDETQVPAGFRTVFPNGHTIPYDERPSQVSLRTGRAVRNVDVGVEQAHKPTRWLTVSVEPMRGPNDENLGVVVTFSDVTERRRAERELAERLGELQVLMTALPGVVIFRAEMLRTGETRVTYLSAGAEALIGRSVEPGSALDLETFVPCVHPDDWARVLEGWRPYESVESSSRDFEDELRLRPSRDAPWRWTSIRARHARHLGGVTWTGTIADVDEQRRMAEGLRQTQKMEAVGVLASGVAHNFNNMLAAIIPNLEQAGRLVGPEVRPYLTDAAEAAHTAKELVRQLLVVARKDPHPDHRPVDLVEMLRGLVRLCRRSFGPEVQVELDLVPDEAWVSASPSHLNQVFLNLCNNARDAMRHRARARLGLALEGEDGQWRVAVVDTGEGMSQEVLQRLGEPFFTTKGPDRGTGLGVATAFGILRDHGGTLTFDSHLGRGTRATVNLPRLEPPSHAVTADHAEDALGGTLVGNILVVDDEDLVRRAIRRTLEREGHTVRESGDGNQALKMVDNHGPELDLVLLDIAMPGRSGYDVLEAIVDRRPVLPVALMTGLLQESHPTSAAAVLQKPMDRAHLLETVQDLIVQSRAARDEQLRGA